MRQPPVLHVLGGGEWRVPTVRKAQALGYRVLVTDLHDAQPAYGIADHHEVIDIMDMQQTLHAARRHGVSGILSDTSDIGVTTAAFVAESLGLRGIGALAAEACTNKCRMRALTTAAGMPVPAYRIVTDEAGLRAASECIGLPLVVKAANNQSGRGISVVRHADELAGAWQFAREHSRGTSAVLVEGFVAGEEFIVDAFGTGNEWHLLAIAAKTPYADNPCLSSRILYLDGVHFERLRLVLEPALRAAVEALGVPHGLLHAEFMLAGSSGDPVAVLLDVAARGGGVLIYQQVIPHVSGVDLMAAAIHLAMGQPVSLQPLSQRRGGCIEFVQVPAGDFVALEGLESARSVPGVVAVHVNAKPGQRQGPARHKDDRPAYVVALAETAAGALRSAQSAKGMLHVHMGDAAKAAPVF